MTFSNGSRNPSKLVVSITSSAGQDLLMLSWGAYAPLTGFMVKDDYDAVLSGMRLASGQLFPIPVVLPVPGSVFDQVAVGDIVVLVGPHRIKAELTVTDRFVRNLDQEAERVYQTRDKRHPGVHALYRQSAYCLSGSIRLMESPEMPYAEHGHPEVVRSRIQERGWNTVAFFQTRNPIHRAHEYLHKVALEICDGLVIHPLVGDTKADDVPVSRRMASYHALLSRYYPTHRTLLATFPSPMRFAGPREALFHALVRRNYGATHFIVGRDAAGVGQYYDPEAAVRLVRTHADELGITPLTFDQVGYCPQCQGMGSRRTCPHPEQWLALSGTEVRSRLNRGEELPHEFMRPEVSRVLMNEV